jgi:hypothetical protein
LGANDTLHGLKNFVRMLLAHNSAIRAAFTCFFLFGIEKVVTIA